MAGKIILGLDPGTVRTGFALVDMPEKGESLSLLDLGVLSAPASATLEERLLIIGRALQELYQQYSISDTAIEQIFVGKNPDSAFKLGQIFGICVYQAAYSGSEVFSYAARYVKKSVTGKGSADKKTVQTFVLNIFGRRMDKTPEDATDALAVALCHTYQKQSPVLQSVPSDVPIGVGSGK